MQKPAVTVMVKAARARRQRPVAQHQQARRVERRRRRGAWTMPVKSMQPAEVIVKELKRAIP
jgi:hypothetical protein